jgi:ABC-type glycerol-3-phosphate transport system substrate-binding protein
MFIPTASDNKDAAWEWIKAYTSEANARRWFETYGIGSVYVSTYENPELLKKHGHDFPGALANFKRAKNPPLSGEAQDFLASTIGEVLTGQIEPAAAIAKVNEKWATITVPSALLEAAEASGLKAK